MKTGNVMATHFGKMVREMSVNEHGLDLLGTYIKLINEKVEDGRFKKHAWKLEGDHENSNLLVIQYTGDEIIYNGQAHDNNKKDGKTFVRTKPFVIKTIKQNDPKNPVPAMHKINSEINADCKETGFSNVRNKMQVKQKSRNKCV